MEDLKESERELLELIAKKKELENQLATIESNIYALESSYLEESTHGNCIRGYEGYGSQRLIRRTRPTDADRIFSQSSLSYLKAIESNQEELSDDQDYRPVMKKRRYED